MVPIQLGFKNMIYDIFHILQMALTTKMGISITLLCAFIYFTSLLVAGGFKKVLLVLTLFSIFGFLIMSFFTWFSSSNASSSVKSNDDD